MNNILLGASLLDLAESEPSQTTVVISRVRKMLVEGSKYETSARFRNASEWVPDRFRPSRKRGNVHPTGYQVKPLQGFLERNVWSPDY